jgi:mRNA interferase RelE/StbE
VFEVEITPEGLRHLNQLPARVRDAAIQAMLGPIAEHPRRVGKPLVGELTGLYSARRGGYRVIYEISVRARRGNPRWRKSGRSWQAWEQAPPASAMAVGYR